MENEKQKIITIDESTNVLILNIYTKDGKDTGEVLEFNLKDIELLDRLDKMHNENIKNQKWINDQLVIIDKKQDFERKGYLLSNNERLKYDALKSFYKKQREIFDMFLGKGGVDKLLYGRVFQWDTIVEIKKIINEQIEPYLDINMKDIESEIKQKYGTLNKGNVLKENE